MSYRFATLWAVGLAAMLACTQTVHAELLGFWSANSPNDDFVIANDLGNADLDGELFGEAAYTADQGGVTGEAGDYALDFGGIADDYAALPSYEDVDFAEITLTAWMKGTATGDWSGIFYSRGGTAIGLGYGGGSGNLTYTWNDNVADTWNFGVDKPELFIPEDEWTFVAMTIEEDAATLYVGAKDGELMSAANEIPHIVQTPVAEWRLAQDNCCGDGRNFLGQMDEAAIWNHRLTAGQIAELHSRAKLPDDPSFAERAGGLRQVQVAGSGIGTSTLAGPLSNIEVSAPQETEGLAQYWFEGNLRGNVEFFLDNGETGSAENALVAGPFASDTTWWAGSQNENVISDQPLPRYPVGLAGTRFEGSSNSDNYAVRLVGEIFIEADGEYLLRDGIDDFTMVAIDQDGNGELDELDGFTSADVGQGQFGDVLVIDDDWANLDGSSQAPEFHGFAEFENVGADGEWRKIEVWMSEGGGGDGGILFMANLDDPDVFDDLNGGALTQEEIDAFVIRNDKLRSVVSVVTAADSATALNTGVEYVLDANADGNDKFVVDDGDGIYNTTLDVAGANIRINADGVADGTTLTIFEADNITGVDSLNLIFDDASQWDLSNLAAGQITFGSACNPNSLGDLDGSGDVGFPDFLIMSANFGNAVASHTEGDVDCNGAVEFPDFLILSANFGTVVGAASVPEPNSGLLIGLGGIALGILRRRR